MLTRDAILARDDLRRVPLEVPEWEGTVHVRAFTLAERSEFVRRLNAGEKSDAWVAVTLTVTEDGKQVFEPGDEERLEAKSHSAVQRIVRAALKANTVDAEDAEKN